MRLRAFLLCLALLACKPAEQPRRIIFLGLDGVDWRLVDRLTADGTMPRLAALMRGSEQRVLLTQRPALSPLVWTTMMTGVSPLEHRILDFTRFNPITHVREPITSDERAVPAVWNMVTRWGRRVGVFGMWATDPPEAVNGVIVSDRAVAGKLDAQTESVRRRSVTWIEGQRPDLAIVYYQGTDEIGHLTDGDVQRARPYFARIDAIIGELHALAVRSGSDLIIASDHGFDWGGRHEPTKGIVTAEAWHLDEGMLLWSSPRGRPPHSARPDRVDQVCATLLALLDLPHDDRLAPPVAGVARSSKQHVDYRRGFRRPAATNAAPQPEAISRLEALGYLSHGSLERSSSTRTAASFNNEGEILLQRGRVQEATAAFEAALRIKPDYAAARRNLNGVAGR